MLLPIFSVYISVLSVITFIAYAVDKVKAKKGSWRTKEKTLLCMSFLGGAIGGCLAMQICRHKTKHWYFHAINVIGLAWQLALLTYLIITA